MAAKPNILFIMADQLRADALGCYGNEVCQSPNIDKIASSGVRFENGFTPNPICVPARATITTGNYPHKATGRKSNEGLIHDDQPKLAEHFASHGYKTYALGKLHYAPYSAPDEERLVHGFEVWESAESGRILAQFDPSNSQRGLEDYMDYLTDVGWGGYSRAHGIGNNDVRPCASPIPAEHNVDAWVADRTINRIAEHTENESDKPFLMFCSFPKPHSPYDPPAEFATMYNPQDMPVPAGDASMLENRNPYLRWTRITHAMDTLSPESHQVIKAYYYGLLTFQDVQIGRVIKALEESGQADNTIIVYTADHGDLMGDFGMYFKCCFQEGSVKVPIIFAGPGVPKDEVRSQLAGLQDILPTLAELTGCPLTHEVDGESLTEVFAAPEAKLRDYYYGECLDDPEQSAMICDGRWKYIYTQTGPTEELYDLENDPTELNNLAVGPDAENVLPGWREKLIEEARRLGDTALLDGDGLVIAEFDRQSYKDLPITGMGWRWY